MKEADLPDLLPGNINKSIVYVDRDHVIRYHNAAGKAHYARFGELAGKSLWDCHNEDSKKAILGSFRRLEAGEDEILYLETPEKRVYIRSVRDAAGNLVGYYEIQEPPAEQP
jgi:hypothetical protein